MPFVPLWIFFGDCLPGVEFPAETQALQVQPEINLEQRRMQLEFFSEKWIEPDTVNSLCRSVAEATNCSVSHSLRFAPACFDSWAYGWLLQKLREAVVVVNGFLHTTQITYETPVLRLATSETGKTVLADVDAAKWIRRFVQMHFDLSVEIEIIAGEEKPLPPAQPEMPEAPAQWADAPPPPEAPPLTYEAPAIPEKMSQPEQVRPAAGLPFSLAKSEKIIDRKSVV